MSRRSTTARSAVFLSSFPLAISSNSTQLSRPVSYSQSPRTLVDIVQETLVKHMTAYKLFRQFTTVVILREQAIPTVYDSCDPSRTGSRSGLLETARFLRRLRNGEQTELDFQRLCRRLYNKASQTSFADGLRAVTPLNQDW